MANTYLFCGFPIAADFDFPELVLLEGKSPSLTIKIVDKLSDEEHVEWFHEWQHNIDIYQVSFGRLGSEYLIKVQSVGLFKFNPAQSVIESSPEDREDLNLFRHILLHQVLPLVLSLNTSHLVLHGSGVLIGESAVAFLGEAGMGKSSLAAQFCKLGGQLITDDVLLIEQSPSGFVTRPSYPSLRLWPDAAEEIYPELLLEDPDKKRRFGREEFGSFAKNTTIPMKELFLLEETDGTNEMKPKTLPAHDALLKLGKHSFRLGFPEAEQKKAEFEFLSQLVSNVSVERLPSVHNTEAQASFAKSFF